MKHRVLFLLIGVISLFPCISVYAQLAEPVYSVPTADVATLGEFGAVPVSHFTGVPQIDVPLYTIDCGDISWPIGFSYHLSSVRPCEQPGSSGIGWAPMWDACITRTVRGVPDEKKSSSGAESGYYGNRLRHISNTDANFYSATMNNLEGNGWYELSADEFSFSVAGLSGNFYLGENGEWVVASEQAVKVEFNPQTDFLTVNDLSGRIPGVTSWPYKNNCSRFFGSFTLVGPDGTRYVFGGKWATDFSIDYYSRNTSDLIATAWHIVRVETAHGHVLIFDYENEPNQLPLMVDLRYVSGHKSMTGNNVPPEEASVFIKGRKAFSGFLLFPCLLKKITGMNEEIKFKWLGDLHYGERYLNDSGDALYWEGTGDFPEHLYTSAMDNPSSQFLTLLPSGVGTGESLAARKASIADALSHKILHRISVRSLHSNYEALAPVIRSPVIGGGSGDDELEDYYSDEYDSRSYYMEYEGTARNRLSSIKSRVGIPGLKYEYISGGGMVFPILVTPGKVAADSIALPEWDFKYNTEVQMPLNYVFPTTDSWGYWMGGTKSPSEIYVPTGDAPVAGLTPLLAETIKKVTWPTGGSSEFSYERNSYSKILASDRSGVISQSGFGGGLRIAMITVRDNNGRIAYKTRYQYEDGISEGTPVFSRVYSAANNTLQISSESGFRSSSTNHNSPVVGYSTVTEERLDSTETSIGRIKYSYSNYDTGTGGESHLDENAYYTVNVSSNGVGVPFTSHSAERGKLLKKEWYSASGQLLRREQNRYSKICDSTARTATQQIVYFKVNTNPGYQILASAPMGWLTHTHTYSYLPVETTVTEYTASGEGTVSHTYRDWNNDRLPLRDSTLRSDSLWSVSRISYASDNPSYSWMRSRNIRALPETVSTKVYTSAGDSLAGAGRIIRGEYSSVINSSTGAVPYLRKVVKQDKTLYEVDEADAFGKPTHLLCDSLNSCLSWGMAGQRLLYVSDNCPDDEPDPLTCSDAQVRRFSYGSAMNVTAAASADSIVATFSYDKLGRLTKKAVEAPNDSLLSRALDEYRYTLRKKENYTQTTQEWVDGTIYHQLSENPELNPVTGDKHSVPFEFRSAEYEADHPTNLCTIEVSEDDTLRVRLRITNFDYYHDVGDSLPPRYHPFGLYLLNEYTVNSQYNPSFTELEIPFVLNGDNEQIVTRAIFGDPAYNEPLSGPVKPVVIDTNGDVILNLLPGLYYIRYDGIIEEELAYGYEPLEPEEPDEPDDPGEGGGRSMGLMNYPSFRLQLDCLPVTETGYVTVTSTVCRDINAVTRKLSRDGTVQNTDISIGYVDGLGRRTVNVQVGASPGGRDLVSFLEYDGWGRQKREWLPFAVNGNSPAVTLRTYSSGELAAGAAAFYGSSEHPYAYPVYEQSVLGRVTEQFGPGRDWHNNNKSTGTEYLTNTAYATNPALACRRLDWSPSASPADSLPVTVSASGYYAAGTLQVTRVTDEDGRIATEFKDMAGQTVLTRATLTGQNNTTEYLDTYYVYDAVGNLVAVLPPKASSSIVLDNEAVAPAVLGGLCYLYRYDSRDRCTKKKLPGAGAIFYVYDDADRVILTQDGNNRANGKAVFSLYDVFGRPTVSGTCTNAISISQDGASTSATGLQGNTVVLSSYAGTGFGLLGGYAVSDFTISNPSLLSATWYDSYDFAGDVLNLPSSFITSPLLYAPEIASVKSHPTGSWIAIIGGSNNNPSGTWTITRYDFLGRESRIITSDHLGGITTTDNQYNHRGSVTRSHIIHTDSANNSFSEEYANTYDNQERLLTQTHSLNNATPVTLVSNTYDAVGRLISTGKANDPSLTQTYAYNIRSWMTALYGNLFTERLHYNDAQSGSSAQWGGNISSLAWTVGSRTAPSSGFDFSYDGLSRLTATQVRSGGSIIAGIGSGYTYDPMGNLLSMSISSGEGTDSRQFAVASQSNKLAEETYDANGNRTTGVTDGFDTVSYNLINLPETVTADTLAVHYLYSASGAKLQENVTSTSGATAKTTDYCSNLVYKGGILHKVLTSGGYIETSDSTQALLTTPAYRFFLTDHLGSVRVVADASGNVLQRNDYLPYGEDYVATYAPGDDILAGLNIPLIIEEEDDDEEEENLEGGNRGNRDPGEPIGEGEEDDAYHSFNPYKFSGKEQVRSLYDFGARWFTPKRAHWTTMDPLAEKYFSISPYAYCAGNPVNIVDPEGKEVRPKGQKELDMIRNTLPPDSRKYVTINESGNIDYQTMKQYNGISLNYSSLLKMVESSMVLNVIVDDKFKYADKNGKEDIATMEYGGVDKDFCDVTFETLGVTTGETGFLGKTLFPDRGGLQNSTSNDIDVIVNSNLTELGAAEIFSHEGYGHAFLYMFNGHNHGGASHNTKYGIDKNKILVSRIREARKETVNNMR